MGWLMPPAMRTRNAVILGVPSLFGEYEAASLRRYEFERILSRELVRSGVFERVVSDPVARIVGSLASAEDVASPAP